MPENEIKCLRWFSSHNEHLCMPDEPGNILGNMSKDLGLEKNECRTIVDRLRAQGLIEIGIDTLKIMMTSNGIYQKRTTPAGDRLLAEIEAEQATRE